MSHIRMPDIHDRLEHGTTSDLLLDEMCSLVDSIRKLELVSLTTANAVINQSLAVLAVTSWNPLLKSLERGIEKKTWSGFLAAISSTIAGTSRFPYGPLFSETMTVPQNDITE